MSIFKPISTSAFQLVTRPDEQSQDPLSVIPAQETHQLLLNNREAQSV